jgi:long-chain acyl-CoA synthetase
MISGQFTTLTELFLRSAEAHPKPDAFLVKSGAKYQPVSAEDALRQAAALAAGLARMGLGRGDRLAIISENRIEWALTDYAALGLGVVVVPLYPTLLEPDIEFILSDSECKAVVVSTDTQLQKILRLRSRLPSLKLILSMDPLGYSLAGTHDWHHVVRGALSRPDDPVPAFRENSMRARPEDTATILYTSGTVGEPKGVVLTHHNIVSNVHACEPLFPLGTQDVGFSFLPLSHVFERMLDYYCFSRGVTIAYPETMEAMPQNLLEVRPTIMAVVPRVLERIKDRVMEAVRQAAPARQKLFWWANAVAHQYSPFMLEGHTPTLGLRLKHAVADRLICAKVRARMGGRIRYLISGAAPLSKELAEFFHAMGLPVYEGYGLTETSPVISVNYPGHIRLGTVGPVIAGVEVKMGEECVDEEGRTGCEILVRGPSVTPGYYHADDMNERAFVGGWFRTGDLGTLDADGYLRITGRKKHLFKTSGGKYVSPDKIENLFQGHPYVAQIMVIGESRRFVSALIVPNFARLESYARSRGIPVTTRQDLVASEAVHALLTEQIEGATPWLAPHEKIRQFTLLPREFTIESGELTPTHKIKRRVVEERYRAEVEAMYSSPPRRLPADSVGKSVT